MPSRDEPDVNQEEAEHALEMAVNVAELIEGVLGR